MTHTVTEKEQTVYKVTEQQFDVLLRLAKLFALARPYPMDKNT